MTKRSMTASTVSDNPCIALLIRAAKQGDNKLSAACLLTVGWALQSQQPPDPAIARYVGKCLVKAALTSLTSCKTKTDKKATQIAKALGLISSQRGPKTGRFKPVRRSYELASLVVYFRQSGHPLTRKEDGAFYRAAMVAGCRPGTVEAAYGRFKNIEAMQDSASQKGMLIQAEKLIRFSRKRD